MTKDIFKLRPVVIFPFQSINNVACVARLYIKIQIRETESQPVLNPFTVGRVTTVKHNPKEKEKKNKTKYLTTRNVITENTHSKLNN